jgi:hypothetical protein
MGAGILVGSVVVLPGAAVDARQTAQQDEPAPVLEDGGGSTDVVQPVVVGTVTSSADKLDSMLGCADGPGPVATYLVNLACKVMR